MLDTFPYTTNAVERELGMFTEDHSPKPVLLENKKFADFLKNSNIELPKAKTDAVCILTYDQDHWGNAYMTYALARKAGLNISYTYACDELPCSDLYIMPSVIGTHIIKKDKFEKLLQKVYDGADLYISLDNGAFSQFEKFSGLAVTSSYENRENVNVSIDGVDLSFPRLRNMTFKPTTAQVLVYDTNNTPFITVNSYGKGRVFVVNAPVESSLIGIHNAFDANADIIYRKIFGDKINNSPVKYENKNIVMTLHPTDDGAFAVLLNFSASEINPELTISDEYITEKVYYGNPDSIKAYDACVIKFRKA